MPPPPARPHLRSALAALLTVVIGFGAVEWSVRRKLPSYMDRFAATMAPVKLTGNVLQTTAFRSPETLVIYGSSELDKPAENRPDAFFSRRPTGFDVFPIGKAGNTCLIMLEKLAAAGEAVRGKKVGIFLSPSWFLRDPSADALASSLRPLQVGSWVFGHALTHDLRRDIARRLVSFPEMFARQPLLTLGLHDLADDTAASRLRLAFLTPLGRVQNFLLERAEYWAILRDLSTLLPTHRVRVQQARAHHDLAAPTREPDWDRLAAEGEAHDRALGDSSPFSIGGPTQDPRRLRAQRPVAKPKGPSSREAAPTEIDFQEGEEDAPAPEESPRDEDFYAKLAVSSEWTDLGLLLQTLHELGADALIISQPFNGRYRDSGGNTPKARRAYYDRLDQVVGRSGYAVRDFAEHEEDRAFFSDSGHPSAKAWVYYDQALNTFYHGRAIR